MKRSLLSFLSCLALAALPVASLASSERAAIITPVATTAHTVSGQPIELPPVAELHVSVYSLAAGQRLPTHKHAHQRIGYILEGTVDLITVVDEGPDLITSYKAGDFLVEMRDEWHYGKNNGAKPAKLLIVDVMPPDTEGNVILQNKVAPRTGAGDMKIFKTTITGQPITMPEEPEIRALIYDIAGKSGFPLHKHPYLRVFHVISGSIDVIDGESFEIVKLTEGDFIVEAIDRLHYGENNQPENVRILVIDFVPVGSPSNTILKGAVD